jgi:hypothetical protein
MANHIVAMGGALTSFEELKFTVKTGTEML